MTSPLRDLPVGTVPNEAQLKGANPSPRGSLSLHDESNYPDSQETCFPTYCVIDEVPPVAEIYSRSLLSLGNGIPLFDPIGSIARPQDHIQHGALLGDVGYMNENGDFSYCFNIFFPKEFPAQPTRTPKHFVPFYPPPTGDNIVHIGNYFKPGAILTSEGVEVQHRSKSSIEVEFASSAPEGAVLILPQGARREDLVDPSPIFPYIRDQAIGWYQFCNGDSERTTSGPIANGRLFVVIGVDRAESWSLASFPDDLSYRRKASKARLVYKQDEQDFFWENNGRCNVEHRHHVLSGGKFGAVFLRILSVALSPDQWSRHIAYVLPEHVPYYSVLSTFSLGFKTWLRRTISRKAGGHPSSQGRPISFHPSIILINILLLTISGANVGVIPDSIWLSKLSQLHLSHTEVVELIRRILDSYDVAIIDEIAMFTPKPVIPPSTGKQNGTILSFINRVIPWIFSPGTPPPTEALQNMAKVLGMHKL